ncbi:MAG: PAS domain-containing sensor histidine kinase [Candidatus Omnitrophica bacterium]|nr:PAS domain-containing sensor histidine kinase [Candidatus Omnitrophota bacterium]MDD5311255.1 PAS domain-containing sensor histidine kinase [Candidatus Omnitrophota bacterium]MDD5546964.1 PAS domain-containing sensor histidine kinase [Candidatus Omnitrophota bacterium]
MSRDELEIQYRELVENANSIILRMDMRGDVTYFNRFAQNFFGYRQEEILGKNVVGTIVAPTDSSGRDLKAMIDDMALHPSSYVSNENENVMRNGTRVWIAWTNKSILDEDGLVREILCIGNDITRLKEAEQEIVRAKEAAESANKAKSSFLANMSHELRTPLNAIIGFSELMKDGSVGPLTDKQKEYLDYVWESGKHLLSLINDILDLSKVEAGKMELELGEFDLKELLKKSFIFISEKATKHGITLSADVSEGVGVIKADERKIKQVIFNLLSNAMKFTPDGGKIGIDAKKTDKREILVCVWDTGIGIEARDNHKIFSEFEQVDSEYSRKYAGTGLGMPLSKKFVELHGGKMWFESEGKGKGTRFYFTLPLNTG